VSAVSDLVGTIVVLGVAFSTHWLAWRWARSAFPRIAVHRKKIWIAIGIFLLLGPIVRQAMHRLHLPSLGPLQVTVVTEMAVVAVSAIPLLLIHLLTRLIPDPKKEDANKGLTRRQIVEGVSGVAVLGTTGSLLGWGAFRGRYDYHVEEVVVRIPGLSKTLDGYTIAQVSDIHVGTFVGEAQLRQGLSRVKELKPDLVVATGDLCDFDPRYARMLARALADLAPRDGVACVPGNHDYFSGARTILEAMRAGGIEAMVNSGKIIRPQDGGGFALLGLDDLWAPRGGGTGPILSRALAMVPEDAPRIALSHQPASVDMWAGKVALQLSGHTHGGQINPGFRPADLIMRYVAGRYEVKGTTLWVNRGFGTSGPPTRVGAPPEVTKIILVSA
jgi:hypothetical protein